MKKGVFVLLLCVFLSLPGVFAWAEDAPAASPEPSPGAQALPVKASLTSLNEDYLPIDGAWDEEAIPIHNGVYKPYILDKRLRYCMKMTMLLSVVEYTGYPFGDWYLYALDLKDNWAPIGQFRLEKEQEDGEVYSYDFSFWPPESFKALSICTREKGAEFTLEWDIEFYAP